MLDNKKECMPPLFTYYFNEAEGATLPVIIAYNIRKVNRKEES